MAFFKSESLKKMIENDPIVLIDVGARGGISGKWKSLNNMMKIIGFEPDEEEFQRLGGTARINQIYLPVALFNKKGKIKLNITRNPECASILEPDYAMVDRFLGAEDFETKGFVEINSDTLDEAIKSANIGDVDFIKLDTQGSELQILHGAETVLEQYCVFGIEVEVEFSQLYKDQPLFTDVDSFLRERGFTLFDIRTPLGRKVRKTVPRESRGWKGQGLWTDALYFRDFVSKKDEYLENISRGKAIKTIAIAELHGFGDFALELLDLYLDKKILSDLEYADIKSKLLSSREGKFEPEFRLYQNVKSTAAEFLYARFPSIHKLIVKTILRYRSS